MVALKRRTWGHACVECGPVACAWVRRTERTFVLSVKCIGHHGVEQTFARVVGLVDATAFCERHALPAPSQQPAVEVAHG